MNKFSLTAMIVVLGLAHAASAEVVAVRRAAVTPSITFSDEAPITVNGTLTNAPMPLLIHGVATEPVRPSTVLLIGVLRPAESPMPPRPGIGSTGDRNAAPGSASATGLNGTHAN